MYPCLVTHRLESDIYTLQVVDDSTKDKRCYMYIYVAPKIRCLEVASVAIKGRTPVQGRRPTTHLNIYIHVHLYGNPVIVDTCT